MSGGGGAVVLTRTVRLLVTAGAAKPGAALGQALGPLGLNMAEFCKQFNDRTKGYEKDITLPVKLFGQLSYIGLRYVVEDIFLMIIFFLFFLQPCPTERSPSKSRPPRHHF